MPGSDDLLRIINAPQEIAELDKVSAKLLAMKEELKSFSGISLFTKSTNGAADFRSQATALTEALARIKVVETELDTLRASHSTKQRARTDQEIADAQRTAEATRGRVREIRSEEDAYKRLTNEYSKALAESRKLSAEYGIHSKQARAAAKEANGLSEEIQKINKAAGENRTGVGRYTESIKDFAKEALGAAAAFFGLQQGIEFFKDSIKSFTEAEQSTSRLKNILNNLGKDDAFADLNKESKELAENLGTVAQKDVTETFQKLITYGKLTKNQILELTPVIADFAAKQRIDMPEATSLITKALEGNARALKEFGINMKDGKDATERLKIIMEELKPRVDGAAKAFGDTLAGSMKKSEIATEELKVKIGEEFAPAIAKVEEAILEGVKGIPDMVKSFGDAFDNLIDQAKHAYFVIKAGFGSVTDLANYNAEKEQQAKILESNKKYQEAQEYAETFRKAAAKEKIPDQEKELSLQRSLLNNDLARYNVLKASGQLQTENGQKAREELFKSISVVNALQAQLKASKDTSILGFGNPDDQGKAAKDEAAAKEIEAQSKLYAMRLQAAIDYQKILAEEKNNTIAARLEAYNKLMDLERQQVEGERDIKLKNAKLTEGERALIIYESEQKLLKYQVDAIKILFQIRYDASTNDKIQAAQDAKELEDIERAHQKAMDDIRKQALATKKNFIEDARNIELLANEKAFSSGSIDKKKYESNAEKINNSADVANLQDQKSDLQTQLGGANADQRTSIEAQISKINLEIYQKEHADKKKMDEEALAEKKRLGALEIQAAKEVAGAAKSFVDGAYEKQINSIQKQIDKNEELKQKETASINASTLSLQEKAAAQILLDARVNENNEALRRRQRDLKIKEAQFDRAASVLEIAEQGAIAAVAALKIPIYGEAEAIAIGVITAAQIATILAKPIPTYAIGTENHPGGPMIVGEKGPEMRIDPDGKVSMTPGVPTLTFGQKGTKIIPANEVNQMMLSDMMKLTVREIDTRKDLQEIKEAIQEGTAAQLRAMSRKQPIHIHNNFNPGFNDHISNAVRN